MFRPSTTISVALCLACACACLVWTATAARQARERRDATPALRWVPGTRQHYSLETEVVARMHLPGSERSTPVQAQLSGILELAVEDADALGARARLRLAPASYTSAGAPDRASEIGLSTPFHVAFRADGLPLRFDFPPDLADEARTVLEELVRTLQVVVTSDSGTGWTTREENATGRYRADYRVARDGALVKEKTGFEEVEATAMGSLASLEVRLLRSRARVRIDPGASWVAAVELEEEARFLADGKPILESTLRATLTRTTEPPVVPDERASPSAVRSAGLASSADRSPADAAPAAAPPAIDLGAVIGRLLEDLEQSDGKSTASVHALRDLFATYPEAAQAACAALAAGALGDLPAAALINALQLAGTPAAQEALGWILAGEDFGRTNRLRAVLALGGLQRPTSAALDGLWSATSQRSSDEAEELADTCLLALGALAPAERAGSDQELGPVETRLVTRLATAGDEDEQGILLGALGNARNGALAPTVTPYLDSGSAYVRSSAADALGNMPSPAVESSLAGRLEHEPNPRVRTALASALRRMPEPALGSLVLVQSLVVRETSDSARVEMAAFLGEHVDVLPSARQTLEDLMRSDGSPRVRSCAAEALLRP